MYFTHNANIAIIYGKLKKGVSRHAGNYRLQYYHLFFCKYF